MQEDTFIYLFRKSNRVILFKRKCGICVQFLFNLI